ncbi:retrovirus-related pol polyprotein from transposon TNT 1-94, partial [Tanacetum coccineum]
ITADIQGEQYYNAYLEKVAKHQRYLASEEFTAKAPKTTASRPPKPTPVTTEPSKKDQSKKRKLVKESSEAPYLAKRPKADEGVPVNEPRFGDEEADLQKALEESLKDVHAAHQGPLPSVVIREPESGKFQPLLEIQGKGKEKVGEEQAAQAGPNPGIQDEGQAGSNPGDAAVSQPQPSHVVHAGPNLEHMDVEVTDTSIQQNPEQMDEEFITTAYLNVQENLKLPTEDQVRLKEPASFVGTLSSLQNLDKGFSFTNQFLEEKSQEDEPKKTNIKLEVQSMVMVPIHQDTSSVPLMTSPRIDELEQHMANLLQDNLALEKRLDKHGSRLYRLENLDIPHQVSKAVDEIVTDSVDWAIQAPLRDRFIDLPEADMKYILHHRVKKKRRHESLKKPPGSPPHQPPPSPPPAGPSGTSGAFGASGLSQLPPPPLPLSTNQSD